MQTIPHRLCVAPMMARTDRHFRYLMRLISPNAWLYTEMVTTGALLKGNCRQLLKFSEREHPVALQLGGNLPSDLAIAARVGEDLGYDEINLNIGCPSGRVRKGAFGVALMRQPKLVADCLAAMQQSVQIPVTVKTRLGVDDDDSYEFLSELVTGVARVGCGTLIVHARKAWLTGLSPKHNRTTPPLDYERVHRLGLDFPGLEVVINGGLANRRQVLGQLDKVDGVMLGRAAYNTPMLIGELDQVIFGNAWLLRDRAEIAMAFHSYLVDQVGSGGRLRFIARHLMGLYAHEPGARRWRRAIGTLPEGSLGLHELAKLVESFAGAKPADAEVAA